MTQLVHIGVGAPGQSAGGLNRYVADLLSAQRNSGLDASAVVFGEGTLTAGFRSAGPATAPVPLRLRKLVLELRRNNRPEIFDIHFSLYGMPAALSLPQVPVVCHFHGPWAAESRSAGGTAASSIVKRTWERLAYRKVARFVTLSNAFADLLVAEYGVAPDLITVIPPGVDTQRFSPGDRSASREMLGLPAAGRVVVTCRRLVPRMGIADLILAVKGLDLCLVVVGDGSERAALERLARETGTDVRFLGRVTDKMLLHAYRAADLSVVPSRELEGFGLIALESLACGTPVLARPVGGLVEALMALGDRALTPDMSMGGLRSAIERALLEPVPSIECRSHALQFSWQKTVRETNKVYRSLASDWPDEQL